MLGTCESLRFKLHIVKTGRPVYPHANSNPGLALLFRVFLLHNSVVVIVPVKALFLAIISLGSRLQTSVRILNVMTCILLYVSDPPSSNTVQTPAVDLFKGLFFIHF